MSSSRTLIVRAPLSGCVVPLDHVPDPVFAGRMVGDGVSIDPLDNRLVAPCDGRVVHVHPSHHAITMSTVDGVELMVHIGLDTVQLKGAGFTPRVEAGDEVRTGQDLIEFDADYVATHARSLLTQVVVTAGARVVAVTTSPRVTAGEGMLLELEPGAAPEGHPQAREPDAASRAVGAGPDDPRAAIRSERIVVPNPSGLHARPAAVLAGRAKVFAADVRVELDDRSANAKSVVSLMGLEVGQGAVVRLVATGRDAADAIRALAPMIESGLGEGSERSPDAGTVPQAAERPQAAVAPSIGPGQLAGVAASPGVAVGRVAQVRHADVAVVERAEDPHRERRALEQALERAKAELEAVQDRLKAEADPAKAAIFAAHEELVDDPDLLDVAREAIADGKTAAFAWRQAFTAQADRLAHLRNELLAQRANDLRDVGRRVLRLLTGGAPAAVTYPPDAILVAEDLTPSDTATLDRAKVLAFCTASGGATSHVAILARSLGIPAIAGIDPRALDLPDGTLVVLDGTRGTLRPRPSEAEVATVRERQRQHEKRRREQVAQAAAPARTRDGYRVEVAANGSGVADAEQAVSMGAEGIGLLRSEFLFLGRTGAPSEDEQAAMYESIVLALGPERPLIIRTLDVGGDKPLPYLPMPREENPFLGERGVRLTLNRPDVMRPQVRAILRASRFGPVRIMFPMIAMLDEWRRVRSVVESERANLGVGPVPLGIMIEVPSAAILADQFAAEVDFFSIGTNDLTQYTLAMDRGHAKLAPFVDGLHPAVLQLIDHTIDAAHRHGKWAGVCGGIAGDAQAIPLLVGMGIDELSVSVSAVPAVKAQVRGLRRDECEPLARRALAAATAAEVRALVPAEAE